jgi:hypothetical protein
VESNSVRPSRNGQRGNSPTSSKEGKPCCSAVGGHALVKDIDEWLRKGETHGAIRAWLLEQNADVPERPELSRHAVHHLKLDSRTIKKKQATDVQGMKTPEISEILDESLKILLWRLKNIPDEVDTKSLIPFLIQAMRTMETKQKPASDLASRLAQITDAYANQEG